MALIDVIKYEGKNDTLVFKHPIEDFNAGTQLIVHESQEAVFFRNGKAMDRFGSGKYTLDTESLPLMKSFFKKVSGGSSQFHAEVYFVNLATIMGVKWGTDSKIRMYDPISGLHLEIGAFGEFNIHIADSGKVLLKLVGTELGLKREDILGSSGYTTASVSGKFRALVMAKVKSFLPKAIRENNIDILEVDEHLDDIGEFIRKELNVIFESYGFTIPEFFVTNITTPDQDPNFRRLKEQHAERYLRIQQERIKQAETEAATKRAEAEAALKLAVAKGDSIAEAEAKKILAEAEAMEIRVKGLAEADVLLAKGGNYNAETARIVGESAASNPNYGGNSGSGIASEIINAGVGLGVGVSVAKTVANSVFPVVDSMANLGNNETSSDSYSIWTCPSCGTKNDGKFCKECGLKKPEVQSEVWVCPSCGTANDGKFCKNCGEKRK